LTLVIDFDTADGGEIGVDTYSSPRRFGASWKVYDENGALSTGCYIKWTLFNQARKILFTYSSQCEDGVLANDVRLGPGRYEFAGKITTESGRTGSGSKTFTVVDNG